MSALKHIHRYAPLLWLGALACVDTACADDTRAQADAHPAIQEIIVTADYRQTALDKLPVSVSVIGADVIEQREATHLEQLLGATPNLNYSAGSARARYFQIRGIGERSQFAEPLNSSVGLLIDGVDYSGLGTTATLFDVHQVEVLRGPQGTRYGANALAGLINVQSNAPSAQPELHVSAEAANYNSYRLGVAGGGPTGIDDLLYRIAVEKYRSDGFTDNRVKGDKTGRFNETTLRTRLRWQPSDTTTADLTLGYVNIDDGYDAFSLDNNRHPSSDQPGQDQQRSRYAALAIDSAISQGAKLEVRIGIDATHIDYGYDEDWVYVGFNPDEYSSKDDYRRDRDAQSYEARLLSTDDGKLFGGRTSWLVGLYDMHEQVDLTRTYTFLDAPFLSRFDTQRRAAYAQFDTDLGSGYSLGVGARVERRDARYHDSDAVRFDPNETLWGGELALSRLFDNGVLAYLSFARGYKAGGFNTDGSLAANLREFGDERSLSLEFGVKGSALADKLDYRVALFSMKRQDIQIASSITVPHDDGSSEFIDFIGNAASGMNSGLEAEFQGAITDDVKLFGSLGILHTEYRHFVNSKGENLDGRDQAQAPRWQYDVGVHWSITPQVSVRLENEGKAAFYFDDSNNARSGSYRLLHARLEYAAEHWQLALWGRNLTNKDYQIRGFVFGNDPRIGYVDRQYTQLGEPRRIGITLSADL